MTPKFPLGRIVATRAVHDDLDPSALEALIRRHASGDWGDLDKADKAANDSAVGEGDRILSAYTVKLNGKDTKVWIITEADRSSTTILYPYEY